MSTSLLENNLQGLPSWTPYPLVLFADALNVFSSVLMVANAFLLTLGVSIGLLIITIALLFWIRWLVVSAAKRLLLGVGTYIEHNHTETILQDERDEEPVVLPSESAERNAKDDVGGYNATEKLIQAMASGPTPVRSPFKKRTTLRNDSVLNPSTPHERPTAFTLPSTSRTRIEALSHEQLQELANAIANLEGRKLEKVIRIIHDGVPETRNSVEEIELDIETLPAPVLKELYDLAVQPGEATLDTAEPLIKGELYSAPIPSLSLPSPPKQPDCIDSEQQPSQALSCEQIGDLNDALSSLEATKLHTAIEIIVDGVPEIRDSTEELELEIDKLPIPVQRKLYDFVIPSKKDPGPSQKTI
ncbi:transcription initiation at TATA-containing promoter protein [Marasmius crinis-equi]|uniref:Transcription initiation at TATA-containing promoter protein n=1 Tax=Marasmius crinis-equi TaxID=585013 RepID=A0ABR3EPG1_9AGAR